LASMTSDLGFSPVTNFNPYFKIASLCPSN
jgi:hypothetical protein